LQNGRVMYEMESPVREGSITLYQDGGRRLVLDDLWATYSAEVTQEYGTGPPRGELAGLTFGSRAGARASVRILRASALEPNRPPSSSQGVIWDRTGRDWFHPRPGNSESKGATCEVLGRQAEAPGAAARVARPHRYETVRLDCPGIGAAGGPAGASFGDAPDFDGTGMLRPGRRDAGTGWRADRVCVRAKRAGDVLQPWAMSPDLAGDRRAEDGRGE